MPLSTVQPLPKATTHIVGETERSQSSRLQIRIRREEEEIVEISQKESTFNKHSDTCADK